MRHALRAAGRAVPGRRRARDLHRRAAARRPSPRCWPRDDRPRIERRWPSTASGSPTSGLYENQVYPASPRWSTRAGRRRPALRRDREVRRVRRAHRRSTSACAVTSPASTVPTRRPARRQGRAAARSCSAPSGSTAGRRGHDRRPVPRRAGRARQRPARDRRPVGLRLRRELRAAGAAQLCATPRGCRRSSRSCSADATTSSRPATRRSSSNSSPWIGGRIGNQRMPWIALGPAGRGRSSSSA